MLKKRRLRLVFYQMQRRQNTCSLIIMLILGSKHETTKYNCNWTCWELQVSGFMDQWLRAWLQLRKASAWIAWNKMRKEWTSKLPRATKVRLFRATVESVLLYGSETWTVTKKLEESVNGCYTRMMRTVLNVHWQQRMNNEELYGSLPRISETIRARRLRLPGHCGRHNEETASKVLLGNHNKVIQFKSR